MTNLPIDTHVTCTDGACGRSTNVIVNPVNRKVTHLVIEDKRLPDSATRIVPIANVAAVAEQQITLNCARADVAKMPPFIVTNFIQESASGSAYASGAAYTSQYVIDDTAYDTIEERNVPVGELALFSGMHVKASDGRKIGKLDELVLDSDSGEITNLLMRKGHLWGAREIAIPVAEIEFSDGDTVYLTIDTTAVQALPAVKVKRA